MFVEIIFWGTQAGAEFLHSGNRRRWNEHNEIPLWMIIRRSRTISERSDDLFQIVWDFRLWFCLSHNLETRIPHYKVLFSRSFWMKIFRKSHEWRKLVQYAQSRGLLAMPTQMIFSAYRVTHTQALGPFRLFDFIYFAGSRILQLKTPVWTLSVESTTLCTYLHYHFSGCCLLLVIQRIESDASIGSGIVIRRKQDCQSWPK